MRKGLFAFLFASSMFLFFGCFQVEAQVDPNLRNRLQTQGPIIVNHSNLYLFDQIPQTYKDRAANIRMVFSDRSVGQNITEALDCLAAPTWNSSSASCRRDYDISTTDPWDFKVFMDYNTAPERIRFPSGMSRSNWSFVSRAGDWESLTEDFLTTIAPPYMATTEVQTYQFSYLNVGPDNTIAKVPPCTVCGFFTPGGGYDNEEVANYYNQHPSELFIYWTSSLSRGIGTQVSDNFNAQVRDYVRLNKQILIDVADIQSHDDAGRACYDNRDGVQFCNDVGNCENYPDDGVNNLAICHDYTTETEGGHLGSVSAGRIRIAKAIWIVMAQVAGWVPGNSNTPTPTRAFTPTSTPTRTPTPTQTFNPADANGDGKVDGVDYLIWLNHFNQTLTGRTNGDFNNSGRVDGADFVIWTPNYEICAINSS